MKTNFRASLGIWLLVQLGCLPISARAQPALDRVEERLRREAENNPPADPQPAPAATDAEPGYLGLVGDDRRDAGKGVRLMDVVPGGPADKAGLRRGDLIIAINGQAVKAMADMGRALERMPPGSKVHFQITRDRAERAIDVVLGRRPAANDRAFPKFGLLPDESPDPSSLADVPQAAPRQPARLGLRTMNITEQGRRDAKPALLPGQGALVTLVAPGSPAERAGIPRGAVVTDVNGQRIEGPQDLAAAVHAAAAGQEISLTYHFQDKDVKKQVLLDAGPGAADARVAGHAPEADFEELPGPARGKAPEPNRILPDRHAPRAGQRVELPRPADAGEDDATEQLRVDLLERRIRQLEERIRKLEAAQGNAK